MIDPRSTRDADIVSAPPKSPRVRKDQRRPRLVIDFASRSAALSAIQGAKAIDEPLVGDDVLAKRLAWPRDVLIEQAAILAERGIPIAYVYAAAAATSVDNAIRAIAAAERQEGWPVGSIEDFRAGTLAEWL